MSDKKKEADYYEIKDHQLYITRLGVLFNVFRKNKVDKNKRWMVVKIFFFSIMLQPLMWLQKLLFYRKMKKVDFSGENAPIIILGHWRSGTTHLQSLIAEDPKLGTMNYFMSMMVNVCLLGQGWVEKLLNRFMPDTRPMDNMKIDMYAPQEEAVALTNMTSHAAVYSMFFPKNRSYFYKYQLFQGITPKEKKKWQNSYREVMQIIALGNKGKRLVTKNPFNTSRVKELLELYPDAKFVYIHRNPYEVYRSTKKLYKTSIETQLLHELTPEHKEDMIFENYTLMLQKYLKERHMIPQGHLVEIGYEELSSDWKGAITKIYQELGLPGLEEAMPHFSNYMESVSDYKKNVFKPLDDKTMKRIEDEWAFSFDEWGYEIHKTDTVDK